MKSFLLAVFAILFCITTPNSIFGFEIPKTPFLKNYSKSDYNARTQNWDIAQGLNNIMYFANNQGVLQFDGVNWEVIEMPNKSIVRSLLYIGGDSVLAGAYSEFGVIYHDKKGELVYESWLNKIPKEYQNFNEIWCIHKLGERIIFQSFSHILIFENKKFVKAILPEYLFKYSFLINNEIYVQQSNLGLYQLINDKLVNINNDLFKNIEIWAILPNNDEYLLIGTQFNGFYLFDGQNAIPWENEANDFIKKNNLYSSELMHNGNYAFGSIQNGLIIVNKNGEILSLQNTTLGLQNNTILTLFEDNTQNLWLGLDNGIDYVKTNSPLSYVRKKGGFGTGYTSLIFNNILYAGTNQGLFYIKLGKPSELKSRMEDFEIVESTRGQVWCLRAIENKLYCGHNQGLFQITDDKATRIGTVNGVWDIIEIPDDPNNLLVGSYDGFFLLNKKKNLLRKIKGFEESARHFLFHKSGNIFVGHGYKGIYELKLNTANESINVINFYNGSNKLPNDFGNEVFKFKNDMIAVTDSGVFKFVNGDIEYFEVWDKFFDNGAKEITKIIEIDNSKFWCFKDGRISLITYINENMFEVSTKDFLSIINTFPKGYENILDLGSGRYLIGNEDGYVMYESRDSKNENDNIIVDISSIQFKYKGENTYNRLCFNKINNEVELGKIDYQQHRIKITLTLPYFIDQNLVQFRYRINGGPWFDWLDGNELKLDDLREGDYVINVQSSIDQKNSVGDLTVKFIIEPPLFRRWYSYIFYLLIFFSVTLLLSALIKRRFENEKRRESLKQKKKMIEKQIQLTRKAELAQTELINLRNETLKTDIVHKSKELANTTMSLIHKNKILQQFKNVLTDIKDEDLRYRDNGKINNLIKKIDKEIEHQDNWVVFEKNFDKVHENFLQRLMSNHADLTPKDLRLAAYLRMNLSSKEIAPLLNISIRSVEISRYRLRKKLDLGHDQNLTEYLLSM